VAESTTPPGPREERWDQDPHSPFGRFGMFIKASEHWDPAQLLGSSRSGRPDVVVSLADLRDVYADRNRLRAELAAAAVRAETVEAAYHRLDSEQAAAGSYAGRAEVAEAALAKLLGQREVQWATRTGDDSDGIRARYYPDDEWVCRRRAVLRYGVQHHLVQRDIYPTPWRDAAATPHAALEQLAAEQGDNGGG